MGDRSIDFESLDWTEPASTVGLGEPLSDEDMEMVDAPGWFYDNFYIISNKYV